MKLSPLDQLIARGHGETRSTDCIIAVKKSGLPAPDPARAQAAFPKTASFPVSLKTVQSLDDFLSTELPSPLHIELADVEDEGLLALKMSHVLGDAVSMFQWLKVLFGQDLREDVLELKSFPRKKDTSYRGLLNSETWPRKGKGEKRRAFLYESLSHRDQNPRVLNDLLLYCLLEALPQRRKSVWVPVNVRKNFWSGFGNGLSRLRVYPPPGIHLAEKLTHIRKQKEEAMKNGEVALPPVRFDPDNFFHRIPYELWVRRPWADWGSISLSHLTNTHGFLDGLHGVRGISNLMPAHNGAIFAVTNGGKTDFTLTYDPSVVREEEAQNLLRDFLTLVRAQL